MVKILNSVRRYRIYLKWNGLRKNMLQLRCTGKVQKELGLKPNELSEIKEPDSTLGNWYVNISTIDRRKTFLFVYDHLGKATILALANRDMKYFVPLGVGEHLKDWGIPSKRIIEMDW